MPIRVVPVVRSRHSPDQQLEPASICLVNTGPHLASAVPVRSSSVFTASKQGTRLLCAPSEKLSLAVHVTRPGLRLPVLGEVSSVLKTLPLMVTL